MLDGRLRRNVLDLEDVDQAVELLGDLLHGHVVAPKVMGHSLRLHPLLVIFGLLAGGEIYGFPGILVALPLLAAGRAVWEFFAERVVLEKWSANEPLM